MKHLAVHGPNDIRVDEIAEPRPGPDDIVVKVAACGICGSDVGYARVGGITQASSTLTPLGHEFAGVIAEVGTGVTKFRVGQRVAVNPSDPVNMIGSGGAGALAERVLVRQAEALGAILPLPEGLSFETAAMAEPLSVALHGVNRSGAKPGDKVVVFGTGCIGLGVVSHLKRTGVDDIIAIDKSDERLKRAQALGAAVTLNPDRDDIWARIAQSHGAGTLFGFPYVGSDVFLEVSGAPGVIPEIIANARFNAQLTVLAVHHTPVQVNFLTALAKELSINLSMAYPNEFPEVLSLLSAEEIEIQPMISHRFSFDEIQEAFEIAKNPEASAKVMVMFPD